MRDDFGLRNSLIEALELSGSIEKQLDYERSVPIAQVQNEVIVSWFLGFGGAHELPRLGPPVFTEEEIAALWAYERVWCEVADGLKGTLRTISELEGDPGWRRLVAAADAAHEVLMRRGHLEHTPEQQLEYNRAFDEECERRLEESQRQLARMPNNSGSWILFPPKPSHEKDD